MGERWDEAIATYRELAESTAAVADDFNNLAVCFQQLGQNEEAEQEYLSGLERFYHSERLHRNVGVLLEEMAKGDWDGGKGGSPETDRRAVEASNHLTMATRLGIAGIWEKNNAQAPEQNRIGVGKLTIAIWARQRQVNSEASEVEGMLDNVWGPGLVLEDGVKADAGQEALIFLSRHLVVMGFNVEVYANPSEKEAGMDAHGVMWRPWWAIHAMLPPVWNGTHILWPKHPRERQPHIYISWRSVEGAHLFNSTVYEARNLTKPASFLWMLDPIVNPSSFTPEFVAPLHGVIMANRFHAAGMPRRVAPCIRLSGHAIEQEPPFMIRQTENKPHRFIFAADPTAGADILLREWAGIRARIMEARPEFPEPRLDLIQGFSPALDAKFSASQWYAEMKQAFPRLTNQTGVFFRPGLSQRQIARTFASAGFALLPTSLPEVSAPHLVRAMVMGAIPITSREVLSCINETVGDFDLGPPVGVPQGGVPVHVHGDAGRARLWVDSVVTAATRSEEEVAEIRDAMVEASRARYRWNDIADQWGVMFRRAHAEGNATTCGTPIAQVVQRRDPSEKANDEFLKAEARRMHGTEEL